MSTPRETIAAFMHEMQHGEPRPYLTPDENAEELLRLLKANGLFVGPIVATPEMRLSGPTVVNDLRTDGEVWNDMRDGWLRGDGA